MTQQKTRKTCRAAKQVAECLPRTTKADKVVRELDLVAHGAVCRQDPIQEQLRKCPEAFEVGELIGKMCDRLKYSYDEVGDERCLPPAGASFHPSSDWTSNLCNGAKPERATLALLLTLGRGTRSPSR